VDVCAPNAPDREILDHAHRNRLIILTQDLDFGTLLAVGGPATPSVIQFADPRWRVDPSASTGVRSAAS
jgi:predicted nuclease of predicted toxin-antitoxin system